MSRHDRPTSRRDFLREGVRSLVNAGFGGLFERLERVGELLERGEPKPAPLFPLLSCETTAFHKLLESGALTLESLPHTLRELDIQGVSLHTRHLPSLHPRTLEPLRELFTRYGVAITGLMVSEPLQIQDEANLSRKMDECVECLQAAYTLGAPLVRFHLGGSGNEREDDTHLLERAGLFLQRLLPEARRRQIRITLENRDGVAHRAENLVSLIRGTDSRWVGACLDFGNASAERIYETCRQLAPYAFHVHAKSHAFDARGEETQLEYGRLLSHLRLAGYSGALSIEYMGEGDPIEGVRKTRDLIRRYWRAY
ncbi:MAG: sugar phosphate isomerase/epimerase [Fimbriimonadales bacterium]|nr:sugar phosphate isomerase/epimerase [Fimbriimonadales bacterium]